MTKAAHVLLRGRTPALLAVALTVGLLFHGTLLVGGTFRNTFDAYVHIFFADHYLRGWFDNWEPRWYTGFTVTSYPPGAHQLVALLAFAIGLPAAFVAVQLFAVALLIVGVYRFSLLWVEPRAAGVAALLAAVAPGIAEAVHVFGQLPTTLTLAFLLNAMPSLRTWLLGGRAAALMTTLAVMAATSASHHVTTLFGSVFFAGPVIVAAATQAFRRPALGEAPGRWPLTRANARRVVARRLRRVLPLVVRLAVFGVTTLALLVLVNLAYWLWTSSDPIAQIPIPHASRDSLIANTDAGLLFFAIPWGAALLVLPYVMIRGLAGSTRPLAVSVLVLALLGTGGTTPLPRLLLGGAYDILTLDRFTFWATIATLPFAGRVAWSLFAGGASGALETHLGVLGRRTVQGLLVALWLGVTMITVTLPATRPMQPAAIQMQPIVDFLEKDEHSRYRYLTLGFGDQMAWLSAQTRATTVDGNYHSARRLPALTSTPVERLDGAKYQGVPGLGSLQQFLAEPERYRLKFVFSNDRFYDPLLAFSGWRRIGTLENAVVVWERADIEPLPEVLPAKRLPLWQRLLWGTLPMISIGSALVLLGARASRRWAPFPRLRLGLLGGDPGRPPWRWLDARLSGGGLLPPPDTGPEVAWQPWRRFRVRPPSIPEPGRTARLWRGRLLIGLVAVLIAGGSLGHAAPPTPADTIRSYYVSLDLRRFAEAYALLDPATRPSYEQYRLLLSVRGGLLGDAFAKLSRIEVRPASGGPATAVADVDLTWTTALTEYRSTERVRLVQDNGRWRIVAELEEAVSAGDQLVAVTGVSWDLRGRRGVTDGVTAPRDVLDRPTLRVLNPRVVLAGGRVSVVGEVLSDDTVPADVTVTARVRDASGAIVAEANASELMVHGLLPGGRTPFRIDFETIAGAAGQDPSQADFRPGADVPHRPDLAWVAASLELAVRAVVTDADLGTRVWLSGVQVRTAGTGCSAGAAIIGAGTAVTAVPRLLVARYDPDGGLSWVDATYLPFGILPGRIVDANAAVVDPSSIDRLDLPIGLTINSLPATAGRDPGPVAAVDAPAACGGGRVSVTVDGYEAAP